MKAEISKSREWSQELLDRAVEFHGHGGPLMVVGLRMGLLALSLLNAQGWFDLSCRVRLRWWPPDSCVIDGIQTATGCTMGKHNIEVEERDGIAAEFTTDRERLHLRLKPKLLERIRKTLALSDEEAEQALIEEIIATKDYRLFEPVPPHFRQFHYWVENEFAHVKEATETNSCYHVREGQTRARRE